MTAAEFKKINELENSHWWYVGLREISLHSLRSLTLGSNLKILDIGAGTGGTSVALEEFGTVTCLEPDKDAQIYLKDKGLQVISGGFESLEGAGKYDLITCFDSLCYVSIGNLPEVLNDLHKALNPEGYLFLREPAKPFEGRHDKAVGIVQRFDKASLCRELLSVGFVIEKATYLNSILALPIFVLRRLTGLVFKSPASDVSKTPLLLNNLLLAILRLEKALVRRFDLPIGVTLMIIAKKSKTN